MRGLLVAAVALGLASLPAASACSLHHPGPFVRLAWHDADTLVSNQDFDIGRFQLGAGRFQPLTPTPHKTERNGALSPDGAWLVYGHAQGLGADCSSDWEASYARRVSSGVRANLSGEALHVIGLRDSVVLFDFQGTRFLRYEWGQWEKPVSTMPPWGKGSASLFPVEGSSGLLAAWEKGSERVTIVDVEADQVLGALPVADTILAPSVSPDGRHLAIATSSADGHEVRIYERRGGSLVPNTTLHARTSLSSSGQVRSLTWGREGLVVPVPGALWWIQSPFQGSRVHSIPTDTDLKSPVWDATGRRVAVGQGQSLRLLDLVQKTEAKYTESGGLYVKSTPSLRMNSFAASPYTVAGPPPAAPPLRPSLEGSVSIPGADLPMAFLVLGALVALRRWR